jgi:hypothetical protein
VSEFKIGLRQEIGGPHGEAARKAFIEQLGNPPATDPDDAGTFEVTVEAATVDDALLTAFDALAASGSEDHIVFIEHPNVPGHWRQVPR